MNKFLKHTIVLFVFFVGCFSVFSQNKKQPLVDVLLSIEQKFKVNFSYVDNDINLVTVIYKEDNDLETILNTLENQTALKFNVLNAAFITIVKPRVSTNSKKFQQLEEVVISNYLTTGIYKNNTGSITIKPKQFGILPGLIEPDILQTIQSLPGILSVDETVSNINIRGGTHDQNLILYDGIKMYQSGHFFGLISAFNPYLTKNVVVYKNGTSSKYSDGVSSVIDMKLADELSEKPESGFGVNLINVDGFAILPLSKKTEIQVTARRSITDAINTPTYNQYFDRVFQDSDLTDESNTSVIKNETFYFYDAAIKFLYDISEKDKLRVNFINIYNDLNYDEQAVFNAVNISSKSQLTQQNLATGLSYEHLWNSKLNTNIQYQYSNYSLDAINFDISNNQRLLQENSVLDSSLKLESNYAVSSTVNFNAGLQFSEVGVRNRENLNNPPFTSNIKRTLRTYAMHAEANFLSKNRNTLLKLGLRNNYFEKFNLHRAEPRLHLSQKFLKDFRLEFSGELKSQTTSQVIDLQNDFLGVEKRRWVLANNSTIPIIRSKQVSLGFTYNKNNLLISAEGYLKNVDGITTRSQGFQNQFQFVNANGKYTIKGLDFLVKKQLNKNMSTWLSYSYSSNNYLFNTLNNNQEFPNNFNIKHILNFASTYNINKLKLALGINWHSGKPFTKPNNETPISRNTINYQAPNSSTIDSYLRVDFSTTYAFKIGKNQATLGASVWNLLNKENTINAYYNLNNESVSRVDNTSLRITPNFSFRLNF